MQAIILDTCVVSETCRRYPDQNVLNFLQQAYEFHIPAGVLMELQLGIAKMHPVSAKKAAQLTRWYKELTLSPNISLTLSDIRVLEIWGELAANGRLLTLSHPRAGAKKPRGGQDLHIAAAALAYGLPVATYDIDDFRLIDSFYPLPGLFNPKTSEWAIPPLGPGKVGKTLVHSRVSNPGWLGSAHLNPPGPR